MSKLEIGTRISAIRDIWVKESHVIYGTFGIVLSWRINGFSGGSLWWYDVIFDDGHRTWVTQHDILAASDMHIPF